MFSTMLAADRTHTKKRQPQQVRSASTRAALLLSAAESIVELGPTTGIAEVARRAGVSKGALQHHFGSKADLLVAVVYQGWASSTGHRTPAPPATTPILAKAPSERMSTLLNEMWNSYSQPRAKAAFIVSSDPGISEEVSTRIAPIFAEARYSLNQEWHELFADIAVSEPHIDAGRRFARSHLLGMLVQRQLPFEEPQPEVELEALSRLTLQLMTSPQ